VKGVGGWIADDLGQRPGGLR